MANIVTSLPYPALDEGNRSFPNGSFKSSVQSLAGGKKIQIEHHIENAPFVERLLKSGEAHFSCQLSVALTGYRKVFFSENSTYEIELDPNVVGEPPIIRPMVITKQELEHVLTLDDGVAEIWVGRTVILPKGARIARGQFLRSKASLQSIINWFCTEDENFPNGCFEVRENPENGFMFDVEVSCDLADFLTERNDPIVYQNIGAHMATMCFSLLKNRHQRFARDNSEENNWEIYSNLKMLSDLLENAGILHWSHDDFSPDKAAFQLHHLLFPQPSEEE